MSSPYSPPRAQIEQVESREKVRPLWKAFWLVYIPCDLVGGLLASLLLELWKSPAGKALLLQIHRSTPMSMTIVVCLSCITPMFLGVGYGALAVWRSAHMTRFPKLGLVAKVVVAWHLAVLLAVTGMVFYDVAFRGK